MGYKSDQHLEEQKSMFSWCENPRGKPGMTEWFIIQHGVIWWVVGQAGLLRRPSVRNPNPNQTRRQIITVSEAEPQLRKCDGEQVQWKHRLRSWVGADPEMKALPEASAMGSRCSGSSTYPPPSGAWLAPGLFLICRQRRGPQLYRWRQNCQLDTATGFNFFKHSLLFFLPFLDAGFG